MQPKWKKLQKEINNVSELDSEIGPLVKPKRRKQVRQQKRRRSNDDTDWSRTINKTKETKKSSTKVNKAIKIRFRLEEEAHSTESKEKKYSWKNSLTTNKKEDCKEKVVC